MSEGHQRQMMVTGWAPSRASATSRSVDESHDHFFCIFAFGNSDFWGNQQNLKFPGITVLSEIYAAFFGTFANIIATIVKICEHRDENSGKKQIFAISFWKYLHILQK